MKVTKKIWFSALAVCIAFSIFSTVAIIESRHYYNHVQEYDTTYDCKECNNNFRNKFHNNINNHGHMNESCLVCLKVREMVNHLKTFILISAAIYSFFALFSDQIKNKLSMFYSNFLSLVMQNVRLNC
jgi:hypothetical protein